MITIHYGDCGMDTLHINREENEEENKLFSGLFNFYINIIMLLRIREKIKGGGNFFGVVEMRRISMCLLTDCEDARTIYGFNDLYNNLWVCGANYVYVLNNLKYYIKILDIKFLMQPKIKDKFLI